MGEFDILCCEGMFHCRKAAKETEVDGERLPSFTYNKDQAKINCNVSTIAAIHREEKQKQFVFFVCKVHNNFNA